jgi:hypothetical protein
MQSCLVEHQRRVGATPGRRACVACGESLPTGALGRHCADLECQAEAAREEAGRRARRRLDEERAAEQRRRLEAEAQEQEAALRDRGLVKGRVRVAVLPAAARPLEPVPEERRRALEAHLRDVLARIAAGASIEQGAPVVATDDGGVGAAVCGLCRGRCCVNGGERGYLDVEDLGPQVAGGDAGDAETLVAAYLSFVPARAYVGSCIYHGEAGCGLPRGLMSATCRRYHCAELEALRRDAPATPVLAVHFAEERWVRTALIEEGRASVLDEGVSLSRR